MDNQLQTEESQPKRQPALWALAGFLVLVLAVYHSRGDKESKAEGPANQNAPPLQFTSKPESSEIKADQPAVNWPEISFDELVEHNPFQPEQALEEILLGSSEDQAAKQAVEQALKESREAALREKERGRELSSPDRQVRVLLQSPRGPAAMIGDRVVHVGDQIDEYQVLQIDRKGVVLKPIDEPNSAGIEGD